MNYIYVCNYCLNKLKEYTDIYRYNDESFCSIEHRRLYYINKIQINKKIKK